MKKRKKALLYQWPHRYFGQEIKEPFLRMKNKPPSRPATFMELVAASAKKPKAKGKKK